jgi:hypothetical protein
MTEKLKNSSPHHINSGYIEMIKPQRTLDTEKAKRETNNSDANGFDITSSPHLSINRK